jgi:hypothetical protein
VAHAAPEVPLCAVPDDEAQHLVTHAPETTPARSPGLAVHPQAVCHPRLQRPQLDEAG